MSTLSDPFPYVKGLRAKFRLNFASNVYAQLVSVGFQLVLVPFFLTRWGSERYADWLVLTSIPLMMGVLDFGFSQATANRSARFVALNRHCRARVALHTCFAVVLAAMTFAMATVLVLTYFLDASALLSLRALDAYASSLVLILMVGYVCTNLLCSFLLCCFKTIDRTALGTFLLASRRVVEIVLTAAVLLMGGDALLLATTLLAAQLVVVVGISAGVIRLAPWMVQRPFRGSLRELLVVWKPAIGHAGIPMVQSISIQAGLQMLNQLAPSAFVVAFTMARTLMRVIVQLGMATSQALVPEVARVTQPKESQQARQLVARISRITLYLSFAFFTLGVLLGPEIVRAWGRGVIETDRLLFLTIGAHALAHAIWIVRAAPLMSENRHTLLALKYAAAAAVSLALWWLGRNLIDPGLGAGLLLLVPEVAVLAHLYKVFRLK